MITFAIVAHNEESTVGAVVRAARAAARDGDAVLVVDSASEDDTARVAEAAGAEVLAGPLGKGAAMAMAARHVHTPWLCFLDGDLVGSGHDIPAILRRAALAATEEVMIVGEFEDPPPPPILSNTIAVYSPLIAALFPEAADRFGDRPLSGFRILRPWVVDRDSPHDFGIEAHLNITVAVSGASFSVTPIGLYEQRFRYKPAMGREIARPILNLAVSHGRLAATARPAWDRWVDEVVNVVADYTGDPAQRADYLIRLREVSTRPLPDRGVARPWSRRSEPVLTRGKSPQAR